MGLESRGGNGEVHVAGSLSKAIAVFQEILFMTSKFMAFTR